MQTAAKTCPPAHASTAQDFTAIAAQNHRKNFQLKDDFLF